ncbi:hypothetical protein [Streptomyces cucumeris]
MSDRQRRALIDWEKIKQGLQAAKPWVELIANLTGLLLLVVKAF